MNQTLAQSVSSWLAVSQEGCNIYRMKFSDLHIGNPIIRSLHGGVVGTLMEYASEQLLCNTLETDGRPSPVELTSTTIDYMRVTKDADLFARPKLIRLARRVAFLEVSCWQDEEEIAVAKSSCTFRILSQ